MKPFQTNSFIYIYIWIYMQYTQSILNEDIRSLIKFQHKFLMRDQFNEFKHKVIIRVNARKSEREESPGTYVTERVSRGHFCLALCSFGPPSHDLEVITWRGEGCCYMVLLGQTVKRAQLLKIKSKMSSIWAKGCMFMIVCVLSVLTWLPLLGGGRKSWYIIIYKFFTSYSFLSSYEHVNYFLLI